MMQCNAADKRDICNTGNRVEGEEVVKIELAAGALQNGRSCIDLIMAMPDAQLDGGRSVLSF